MTDVSIDLSAPEDASDPKDAVKLEQFKRDLSYILIHATVEDEVPKGPQITIGPYVLQFKEKTPVSALSELIGNEDRIEGMKQYIRLSLEGDTSQFDELLSQVDIEGLGEIIGAVGEGYSSFPAQS